MEWTPLEIAAAELMFEGAITMTDRDLAVEVYNHYHGRGIAVALKVLADGRVDLKIDYPLLESERKANPPLPPKTYRLTSFLVPMAWNDERFEGYTTGDMWKGWECPYFTKDAADRLMVTFNEGGAPTTYDPATDTFDFGNTDIVDDPENHDIVAGCDIVADGQIVHVYPIGNGSWCWEEAIPHCLPYSDNVVIRGFAGCITVEDGEGKNLIADTVFTTIDDALKAAHKLVWED